MLKAQPQADYADGAPAYDFQQPPAQAEGEYAASKPKQAQVQAKSKSQDKSQAKSKTKAQTRGRSRQSVAPGAVLGFMLVAVLFVAMMMAQIRILSISDETLALKQELADLQTENTRLQIAYESAFNLTEIEDYAIEQLGMQRPTREQIYYINTAGADKAVIVESSSQGSLLDQVSDFITDLASYLIPPP